MDEMRKKVSAWFADRKKFERKISVTAVILLGIIFLLVLSDIREWWKWGEWMEHIKKFHMR